MSDKKTDEQESDKILIARDALALLEELYVMHLHRGLTNPEALIAAQSSLAYYMDNFRGIMLELRSNFEQDNYGKVN